MHAINFFPLFCCADNRVLQSLTMSLALVYNYETINTMILASCLVIICSTYKWSMKRKGETKEDASVKASH